MQRYTYFTCNSNGMLVSFKMALAMIVMKKRYPRLSTRIERLIKTLENTIERLLRKSNYGTTVISQIM